MRRCCAPSIAASGLSWSPVGRKPNAWRGRWQPKARRPCGWARSSGAAAPNRAPRAKARPRLCATPAGCSRPCDSAPPRGRLLFAAYQHLLALLRLRLPAVGILRGAPGEVRLPVHAPLWSCKAALAALVALLLLEGGLGIPGTVGALGRRGCSAGSQCRNEQQGGNTSAHRRLSWMVGLDGWPGWLAWMVGLDGWP